MSAWMVTDDHLDLLATAWLQLIDPEADPQEIGQQLARDNAASIRARYEDRHGAAHDAEVQAATWRFRKWEGNIDPEFLAKQVACYRYQSCETEDWEQRPSFAAVERLMGRLVAMGVDWDNDPTNSRRFDAYPWGVDVEHRTGGGTIDPTPPRFVPVLASDLFGRTVH